jgi:hypothetical protein
MKGTDGLPDRWPANLHVLGNNSLRGQFAGGLVDAGFNQFQYLLRYQGALFFEAGLSEPGKGRFRIFSHVFGFFVGWLPMLPVLPVRPIIEYF